MNSLIYVLFGFFIVSHAVAFKISHWQIHNDVKSSQVFNGTKGFTAPESVDWRDKGVVSPVRDVRFCDCTYAMAAVSAIEAQYAINKKSSISLSVQEIVDCLRPWIGCSSVTNHISQAYKLVMKSGLISEEDYPYQSQQNDYCKNREHEAVLKISNFVSITSEEALQEAVATIGPVSVSVKATHDFQTYKGGIIVNSECFDNDYRINAVVVGYGSENGVDYYILQYSGGERFGESGYFRLSRGNNACDIMKEASYPVL